MRKQESEQNIVSPQAADLLIRSHDGSMALLYLYLCRTGCDDRTQAARDLNFTAQQLSDAYERLEMHGLLPVPVSLSAEKEASVHPIPVVSADPGIVPEVPEYTTGDVAERETSDPTFSALLQEARLIIGRLLSTQDMIKLLGIYDHVDLPAEVVMELMHYVADVYREKFGESRRPSVRAFEKEAYIWKERGITDFSTAELYIRKSRERRSLIGQIKEALDIHGRELTATEEKYVQAWIDMGFQADVVALAYDRTVTNTNKRAMAYMDKILQDWHQNDLHSVQAIEKNDPAKKNNKKQPAEPVSKHPGTKSIWDAVDSI